MHIERFRNEFNRLKGVYATDQVVLFRNPLELYDMNTGKVIAQFDSLEEALAFKIDGKTLEERVSAWTEIVFPVEHGGSGSEIAVYNHPAGGWSHSPKRTLLIPPSVRAEALLP